jgi:RecG-like helicase
MTAPVVTRRSYGLELFAAPRRRRALAVGDDRAQALEKLGITSVQDLLQHYPRYHVDRTQLKTVRELGRLAAEGYSGEVQVHARVRSINPPVEVGRPDARERGRKRRPKLLIKGVIADETGSIEVTWFNQRWVFRALKKDTWAFFYGRLKMYRGRLQMSAPRFETVRTGKEPCRAELAKRLTAIAQVTGFVGGRVLHASAPYPARGLRSVKVCKARAFSTDSALGLNPVLRAPGAD